MVFCTDSNWLRRLLSWLLYMVISSYPVIVVVVVYIGFVLISYFKNEKIHLFSAQKGFQLSSLKSVTRVHVLEFPDSTPRNTIVQVVQQNQPKQTKCNIYLCLIENI